MSALAPLPAALEAAIARDAEPLDRGTIGPAALVATLAEAGWLIAPLGPAEGGTGDGVQPGRARAMLDRLLSLGAASLPLVRLYEGHVNALRLIDRHGDAATRALVAQAVREGALLGVWGADGRPGVTEGSDGALAGGKWFASGLGDVALAVVTVGEGPRMALVRADEAARGDLARWDVAGMVGTRSGGFDCAGLTPVAWLGGPGAMLSEPDFHGGIWRLVAGYAGAMERLARDLAAALAARGQADDPLMRHRVGEAAMEATAARLWATAAADAAEPPDGAPVSDPGAAVATVLLAREAVEQGAGRLLAHLERALGTQVHTRASATGRMMRDLRLFLRQATLDGKLAYAAQLWRGG